MPETFGKRQRQGVKARKAAAREERRVARNQRREERALDPPGEEDWLGPPNPTGIEDEPPAPPEDR
jgi:hypothetical protein